MNIKIYDVLPLVDVLENFRKMCSDIYELHPAKFISAPKLAWQVTLIKTQVKSDLSTNLDVLLYAFKWPERVFEEEYAMQFITTQKLTINIWRTITKIKNRHTFLGCK